MLLDYIWSRFPSMAETFMAEEGLSQSQKIREDMTFCLIGGDLAEMKQKTCIQSRNKISLFLEKFTGSFSNFSSER